MSICSYARSVQCFMHHDIACHFTKEDFMSINISLSLELVCLVNWLLKKEKHLINALVKQALKNGFAQELETMEGAHALENSEQLYATVLDFLLFLEKNLLKNLETVSVDSQTKDAILPVVKKLDADNIDVKALWLSMQQTKAQLCKEGHKEEAEAADILFEKLLKNWKPHQKEPMN